MDPIAIPAGGGRPSLAGALFTPAGAGPRPALLFVHGLDSDQYGYQIRARALSEPLGLVCLTFDLGGHGDSGGGLDDLTPRDHLADLVAAYDVLAAHPVVDPARIGVCGASYGGYLAALLVAERPVRRLLLRAPGLYDDAVLDRPLRERPHSGVGAASTAATRSLARFTGEVLIVASGADEVIPRAVISAYQDAGPRTRLVTLKGVPHQLAEPDHRRRFLDLTGEFFAAL
ncbi:alpha/beta hydrolase family protein [Paractinoplanes maris]|uniref:alpha/beta hydrolase family protein n=1 Tax=Paractinoplanes maris TaxID=1734446 RepID=UPI00201FBE5B|nr:alpha/beta fold hydrolase [Actinoplanes maris]